METILIKLTIDRDSLNNYLGNTPNVSLKDGISEVFLGLFTGDYGYCERCGSASFEPSEVCGSINFPDVEES